MERITIDPDLCAGSQTCTMIAPHAFELVEDGTARYLLGEAGSDDPLVAEAVASCPVMAIRDSALD